MVLDRIERASLYYGLGPRFQTALEWLAQIDPDTLVPGQRVSIDGENVYATRFDVETKPASNAQLEGHQNYADIQFLVSGEEALGYTAADSAVVPAADYDATKDIQFFTAQWDTLTISPGTFYIVWPQDLHAPRLAYNGVKPVRVIVAKVKLD
ncbi:YhcH/YjgK/YiaL family protein [Flavonifractor hominis]|uniref:YhcH/YjgK/YiaL family protein n=1 Tax=Flavonifractor hominis TaxID=3133178 RepID=A0ABV1EM10_9FIRM